jgi:hypothetical protein
VFYGPSQHEVSNDYIQWQMPSNPIKKYHTPCGTQFQGLTTTAPPPGKGAWCSTHGVATEERRPWTNRSTRTSASWSQPNLARTLSAKRETGLSPVGLMCSRDTSSSEVIAEGKVIVSAGDERRHNAMTMVPVKGPRALSHSGCRERVKGSNRP